MDDRDDAARPEAVTSSLGSAPEAGHIPASVDADGHHNGTDTPSKGTGSAKTLSKHQSRKKDRGLGTFFGLPEHEEFIDQFSCALKARILLQGQLYIFKHHLAFHCNIFGYTKTRVLPLKDVTGVRKRKVYGLPSAIEIVCRGKPEVYSSFINRKEAHALISECWQQCSDYAKLFGDDSANSATGITQGPAATEDCESTTEDSTDGRVTITQVSPVPGQLRQVSVGSSTATQEPITEQAEPRTAFENGQALQDPQHPQQQEDSGQASPAPNGPPWQAGTVSMRSDRSEPESASTPQDSHRQPPGGNGPSALWQEEQGEPPPVPKAMTPSAEGTWSCTVPEALETLFADATGYFRDWHEGRGDQNVRLGSWSRVLGQAVGCVRELHFDQPMTGALKGLPMAPKFARCLQTHRLRLFSGSRLVFETTQMMNGIPMAESFKVELRWDVSPSPQDPSSCQIRTFTAVPFSRSSIWKGTIERTTRSAVRESDQDFIAKASTRLAETSTRASPPRGNELVERARSGRLPPMRRSLSISMRRHSSTLPNRKGMRSQLSSQTSSTGGASLSLRRRASRSLDPAAAARPVRPSEDVTNDLIQKASSAYRGDFLRVLRAGLNAEEAAGPSAGVSPFSLRASQAPGPFGTLPHAESLEGSAPAASLAADWRGRLPSLSNSLLAAAVFLLIILQVVLLSMVASRSSSAPATSTPELLITQLAQMQIEVAQLKEQLRILQGQR